MDPCPACGWTPTDPTPLPAVGPMVHVLGPAAGKPRLNHDCANEQALQGALNPDRPRADPWD